MVNSWSILHFVYCTERWGSNKTAINSQTELQFEIECPRWYDIMILWINPSSRDLMIFCTQLRWIYQQILYNYHLLWSTAYIELCSLRIISAFVATLATTSTVCLIIVKPSCCYRNNGSKWQPSNAFIRRSSDARYSDLVVVSTSWIMLIWFASSASSNFGALHW